MLSRRAFHRRCSELRAKHRPYLELLENRYLLTTVTNLQDAGPGSLRDAIASTPTGGTIDFQPGLSGTITLSSGELMIAKDLTIAGPGPSVLTVSGNLASRVFDIFAPASVAIGGLTISNGMVSGSSGSGIRNSGTLTVTGAVVTGNQNGGAFANLGTATVAVCTISANFADGFDDNGSVTTITDCTISGNSGYGVYSQFGTTAITACTVLGNRESNIFGNGGPLTVRNTIVAGGMSIVVAPDVLGFIESRGHNLIGDIGYLFVGSLDPTDLVGTVAFRIDPMLEPLGDYGGPTPTMRPLPGSPVINTGDNADAPDTDQRGFPRIVLGFIDIGAVELQANEFGGPGGSSPGRAAPRDDRPLQEVAPVSMLALASSPIGAAVHPPTTKARDVPRAAARALADAPSQAFGDRASQRPGNGLSLFVGDGNPKKGLKDGGLVSPFDVENADLLSE
jgi:hypothetical protein